MSATTNVILLTKSGRRLLTERLDASRQRLDELSVDTRSGPSDHVEEQTRLTHHVAEMESILANASAPGDVPDDPTVVELGDSVTVAYEDGSTEEIIVVAPVEATLFRDRASLASPLGRALNGRRVGDVVSVAAPGGSYSCRIVARRRAH